MSARSHDRVHPVLEHVLSLADFPDVPTWTMSVAEQQQMLVALARAEAQVKALQLRVLAEADANGVGDDVAAASAADWVAVQTRQVRPHARADLKLAQRLEDLPVLAPAFAAGRVNHAQAAAIVKALDLLPEEVDPREAETHLVELAGEHDALALAPNPNASPSPYVTAAAPPKAATNHRGSATPTTTSPGATADQPASRTAGCSAATTTAASTTRTTPTKPSPTAKSASTGEREEEAGG